MAIEIALTIGNPNGLLEAEIYRLKEEMRRLQIDKENLESSIEALICEDHRNAPDLHAIHQDLGGGCLFCLVQKQKTNDQDGTDY